MSKKTETAKEKAMINGVAVPTSGASKFQVWYWSDPAHARLLARQKYQRLKDSIKERSAKWIRENKDYHTLYVRLNNRIYWLRAKAQQARDIGDQDAEDAYVSAICLAEQKKKQLRKARAASRQL